VDLIVRNARLAGGSSGELIDIGVEQGRIVALVLNLTDYGFAVGRPADIVIVNAESPEQAIAEIAQPLAVFKHGRQTVVGTRRNC
jgi:dihydroorotase-like cyclic amidohydrolase